MPAKVEWNGKVKYSPKSDSVYTFEFRGERHRGHFKCNVPPKKFNRKLRSKLLKKHIRNCFISDKTNPRWAAQEAYIASLKFDNIKPNLIDWIILFIRRM